MKGIFYIPFLLLFSICGCDRKFVLHTDNYSHSELRKTQESKIVNDSILRFRSFIQEQTSRVIAVSSDEITKDGKQSALGNFVCDAIEFAVNSDTFKVDVVIVNRGGLRANLPKGELRVANIFELMPFENEIIVLRLPGKDLTAFLVHFGEKHHPYKGLEIKLSGKIASATIQKQAIDSLKIYTVATSDYLYNGGDGFTFLKKSVSWKSPGIKIRDAIINYCIWNSSRQKLITPYKDARLSVSE